ncbi:tRNA (adenosine(37)-N6)-threonylcarbamoyltransferase complex ATPase subunit type 1 TsaE [Cruoricaptor ignavus]|uniref:tRNA (adenosine(37)-N6)-threonylcarbamoyltransferase complex ATPase subunit type 1 TsaE n=1 Tax=Cruoricaptor ignavus TaxID=1118202 RepID=UPI00370D9413
MEFKTQHQADWEAISREVAAKIKHPLLLLKGNLGAGKTTFTQNLLKALGSTDEVTSPTYSIVNEYETPQGKVFHFDLYRLKNAAEVFDIGIEEYLESGALCIIEWPEVFEGELENYPRHEMTIDNDGSLRKITFK